mgnify:CR=1 FL=1
MAEYLNCHISLQRFGPVSKSEILSLDESNGVLVILLEFDFIKLRWILHYNLHQVIQVNELFF